MDRLKVLIVDFDFFTSVGGGQVFYRRVVERNPDCDFAYPSRGPDIVLHRAGRLPANARPFAIDSKAAEVTQASLGAGTHWTAAHFTRQLSSIAAAIQGQHFDVADFPSFTPAANVARAVFAAYGITVGRIALALLGWASVSVDHAYGSEKNAQTAEALRFAEIACVDAADIRYTISALKVQQDWETDLPVLPIDMLDTLEAFPPPAAAPPGAGPPDLWYVGRLDGAKGPDIFIELAARMDRNLYGRCVFSGPDNDWSAGGRWSAGLLELAASRGVPAQYLGKLSDAEIRDRVYGGRSVVVIPSRTDAFNYVATEATFSGVPILLSERAGASTFLRGVFPEIAPKIMSPDRLDDAAKALEDLLRNYELHAGALRAALRHAPLPAPKVGFMAPIYAAAPVRARTAAEATEASTGALIAQMPLLGPVARTWRATRRTTDPRVSIVIPTYNRPALLATTLAALSRQTYEATEVVVVDDGSEDADAVQDVVASFAMARLVRTSNAGEAAATNRGIAEARGDLIGFLSDDDLYHPELIEESIRVLDARPDAIGTYVDWDIVDSGGRFVEAHRLPEFDRALLLSAHWCLPSVGALIRRATVEDIGGRDTTFSWVSDFDLWLRATALGPLVHIPRRLAFWRLHASNLTISDRRRQMAAERVRLIERLFADPAEPASRRERGTALAAAHMAAAAIVGGADAALALNHLRRAAELDAGRLQSLPPNMKDYPEHWPQGWEEVSARPASTSLPADSRLAVQS